MIRQSNYRNLVVTPDKENSYLDISSSNLLTSSPYFVAFGNKSSSGSIGIVNVLEPGKRNHYSVIKSASGSGGTINDILFSSINYSLLASGDSNGNVNVWSLNNKVVSSSIDDNGNDNISKLLPIASLSSGASSSGSVNKLLFNPIADGIITAICSSSIRIYDITQDNKNSSINYAIDGLDNTGISAYSGCWDANGSLLSISSGDKSLRLIDIRVGNEIARVNNIHQAIKKPINICSSGSGGDLTIYSTGFGLSRERELSIWDAKKLSEPIYKMRIDQGTSIIKPYFDSDSQLLYLSAIGDTNVRVFEKVKETPYIYAINNFTLTSESSRGYCFLPKCSLDIMGCEINRMLILTDNSIQAFRMEVPRKSKRELQTDLFPKTAAPEPALTSTSWFNGDDSTPILAPVLEIANYVKNSILNDNGNDKMKFTSPKTGLKKQLLSNNDNNDNNASASTSTSDTYTSSTQESGNEDNTNASSSSSSSNDDNDNNNNGTAGMNDEQLAARAEDLSRRFSKFLGYQAKFKFIRGDQAKRDDSFTNLKPAASTLDIETLTCNEEYFAFPWEGAGGVYVGNLKKKGKFTNSLDAPLLRGHRKEITGLTFNPFHNNILSTTGDDCEIRIWNIPQGGIDNKNIAQSCSNSSIILKGHENEVRSIIFHPCADNILTTSSLDKTIRIWDINESKESICIRNDESNSNSNSNNNNNNIDIDTALNISWNYDGTILGLSCKDKLSRLIDPRSLNIINTFQSHEGSKGQRLSWIGKRKTNIIITTGFDKMGGRQLKIWDIRDLNKELSILKLDSGSSLLIPYILEDNGVVMLTGKGEKTIRTYEIEGIANENGDKLFVPHNCSEYIVNGDPHSSFAIQPRYCCNVSKVEVVKGLRLTSNTVEPINFYLPRASDLSGYFADDIYPDTKAPIPSLSNDEWLKGDNKLPILINLNKLKLPLVTTRDPSIAYANLKKAEESTERFRKQIEDDKKKAQEKEEAFSRMQKLAVMHEQYNPNLSTGKKTDHAVNDNKNNDVDDDEWGD